MLQKPDSTRFPRNLPFFREFVACVASVSNRVIARKLERKQKKKGSFPSPSPVIHFFFCSCTSFLDEPREETLATQASEFVPKTPAKFAFFRDLSEALI